MECEWPVAQVSSFSIDDFCFLHWHSELESEIKQDKEDHILILAECIPQAQAEAEAELVQELPERVPCGPLIRPVTDEISGTEQQRSSKRPRLSPISLHSEVPTKPATSMPAMVIPHLVSHQTATSPRSMIFDS